MKHATRHHARQGGFVLLMALLVVAVVTALMAGVARHSLARAVQADGAEEQLQLRWGQISCERAALQLAPELIDQAQKPRRAPVAKVTMSVRLGAMEFDMLAADENAKVEVNDLYDRLGSLRTQRALIEALGGFKASVKLQPYGAHRTQKEIEQSTMPLFGSLGQVVDVEPRQLMRAAERITCWSNGKVNFRRASPEVLRAACTSVLDGRDIQQMLIYRAGEAEIDLNNALGALKLDKAQRKRAERVLADQSGCYSVWTTAHGVQRRWYRLAVANLSKPEARQAVDDEGRPLPRELPDVQMQATFDW